MTRNRQITALMASAALLSAVPFVLQPRAAFGQSDAVAVAPSGKTVDARVWPRSYKVDGVEFALYQPQVDSWEGNEIKARQVMAVTTGQTKGADGKARNSETYGVLWLSAKTGTDKEARIVALDDLTVDKGSFPSAPDQEARYLAAARKAFPTTQLVVSLDAIEAQLAIAGETDKASNVPVSNKAPEIIVSLEPAMLVLVDGDPVWRASGVAGVDRVLNTSAPILRYQGKLYLGHAGQWMTATSLDGQWAAAPTPPAPVSQALDQLLKQGGNAQQQPQQKAAAGSDAIKTVYVRTHPAELIAIEGEPKFADVQGTSLSYVTNTPADLFLEGADNWYALLSGRWFTAKSTNGPWSYVASDRLPPDFLKIDSDGPKGAVLASIAGTPEAKEALVANSVPQTATVQRADAKFTATYDGAPQFTAIEGTQLSVAKNSPAPVFRVSPTSYVALSNGVWFTASAATGPWQVATEVPAAIYGIPATSQYHYVTYVRIYGSTPEVVYVGYTPGYYGTVVNNNVVVYGTGYACDPWVGAYYYGCPTTYGYGASFAFGAAVGWSLAFGFGWYDPWYGPYWGPWYYPGYYPGYWPGYWGGAYAWGDVYGRWGNSVVAGRGAAWYNPYTGNIGRAGRGGYYNEATGGRGWGYAGRNTNIYTGNTTAAAGGIRYNPQTGRVVAGHGGAAGNIYTGGGAAAGARTVVNANTGRVTREAGGATRSAGGATAAGGFNTQGAGGDARGAGYVHYDRSSGGVSGGGAVDVNGNIYAGKDGHVYRYDPGSGWQSVTGKRGGGGTYGPTDNGLDRERAARDRGFERDTMAGRGFERPGTQRPAFDRSTMGRGFQGRMGGFRGGRIR
ncbi:hypothetical protein [Sphingopyxis indica]|uniref:Carbohydrate-binding family V/XII n=1 Tax=Sphingopyxis indica TaxID=436663 RepID=A0A239G8K0_9SPHN|nr:hypothetical protein [Sphingopyxis indica]SNS65098.1 hypothetical protein SAMN06295955_10358 [Sphingopyxis indica]